jgi:hypothetical protein
MKAPLRPSDAYHSRFAKWDAESWVRSGRRQDTQEVLRYIGLVAHDKGGHALVGGGDTGAALGGLEREYASNIKECSSGKAFLQVLASGDMQSLPGVRALARRNHIENIPSASVCT